jgi:hypothetical protein
VAVSPDSAPALRASPRWLARGCALILLVAACSSDGSPGEGTGGSGPGGGSAAAGAGGGPSPTGGGGVAGAPRGGSGPGGAAPAGRGGSGSTGEGGAATGGHGGAASGGAGALAAAGRGGNAGAGPAGAGGAAAGTGGAAGGAGAATCTRELLRATIDAYFTALAAHSAAALPVAATVKFTENGKAGTLGEDGLWKTAGMVKYTQSALDVEQCQSGTHAVVPDGTKDIPVALRLRLQDQKITEVETIAARQGDYSVASNPAAIISANGTIKWEDPVPEAMRNTRTELVSWMDKYFRAFPNGVCNTVSSCMRLENGGGNFLCSAGATCQAGQPSGTPALDPRLILADPETGIGVGLTLFTFAGGSQADMHMFKMRGGQVYAVHAILAKATSTGW